MGNKRVVLASASPRRSELLRQIGLVPEILVSHVEEKVSSKIPSQVVMELARQKAEDVADGGTDQKTVFYDETDVEVEPMSEEELREYSRMEEPMDKAGAYAVQGYFARYIKRVNGSYANVMGLPVHRVYQELKMRGFWEQAEEKEHD